MSYAPQIARELSTPRSWRCRLFGCQLPVQAGTGYDPHRPSGTGWVCPRCLRDYVGLGFDVRDAAEAHALVRRYGLQHAKTDLDRLHAYWVNFGRWPD